MKKKGKSLLSYLLILVGIAFGVFVVCVAIIVLSPGKVIAGFTYSKISTSDIVYAYMSNEDSQIYSETYYSTKLGTSKRMLGANDVSKLVINAGAHDVEIRQMKQNSTLFGDNPVDKFSFIISSSYSGIYKASDYPNGIDFNIVYDKDNKLLTLNFKTPSGLNFHRGGAIIVDIPEAFYRLSNSVKTGTFIDGYSTTTLKVVSDKGSVNLGGFNKSGIEVRPSSLADVDISTDSGDITLNENFYACGSTLNLSSNKGEITNKNTINQPNMAVKLSSGRGEINFHSSDIIASRLDINSDKADVRLHDIKLSDSAEAINWTGSRGRFFANNINGSLLGSEDTTATNFYIKYISGQFYLPKGDTCDVEIDKVDGKVKIISKNNNISIKNASSSVVVETQKGNVKLENCTNSIDVTSTNAPVTLTKCSGQIRVKTGKGKISGSISGLVGTDNFLSTDKSQIDIKFDQNMAFNLYAKSQKKNVSIDFASISESKQEFDNIKLNGGDDSKKITLTAKNEITISNLQK